jgi:hypothetical protein
MGQRGRECLRAVALASALTLCAAVSLSAAGAAQAAGFSADLVIGPIKAAHGFTVTLRDTGCDTRSGALTVQYVKRAGQDSLVHEYTGRSSCRISGSLASGSLTARWGNALRLRLAFIRTGRRHHGGRPPTGCAGAVVATRTGRADGRLGLMIHARALGAVNLGGAAAVADQSSRLRCTPSAPEAGTVLSGRFGSLGLAAIEPARGERTVSIEAAGSDAPARGVTGELLVRLAGGPSLFDVSSGLAGATVSGAAPFTRGALSFSSVPACAGYPGARNGTFGGTLTVLDPVRGALSLVGPSASEGALTIGRAKPGPCNGIGSTPAHAGLDADCTAPGTCSVAKGTNTVLFDDTSDPGSGTIQREAITFGDGSPAAAMPVGGSVNHRYASPGTYTATLTIVDGQGSPHTASVSVYIGS